MGREGRGKSRADYLYQSKEFRIVTEKTKWQEWYIRPVSYFNNKIARVFHSKCGEYHNPNTGSLVYYKDMCREIPPRFIRMQCDLINSDLSLPQLDSKTVVELFIWDNRGSENVR